MVWVARIVRGIETLPGAAGLSSPSDRDGTVLGEDLGRLQESLGVDACREERLARCETGGKGGAIENAAFVDGGNACSATARPSRVNCNPGGHDIRNRRDDCPDLLRMT